MTSTYYHSPSRSGMPPGSTCSSDISNENASSTGGDVVEYTFSADPDWAADAVQFTSDGLELNFEKLSSISSDSCLPHKISITLVSSPSPLRQNGSLVSPSLESSISSRNSISGEHGGDDSIISAHFTPSSRREVAKLKGARSDLWTVQQQPASGQLNLRSVAKTQRRESIIEQDIRLQKERDNEFFLQRETLKRASTPSPPPSYTITSKGTFQQQNGSAASSQSDGESSTTDSTQQNGDPLYASESPIDRDIRVTQEREEAHRAARQHSVTSQRSTTSEHS